MLLQSGFVYFRMLFLFLAWGWVRVAKTVYVLKELWLNVCLHRIENEVNSFASGHFGGWHEIGIACKEDNAIDKAFEGKGGDVDTYFHIDAFLAYFEIDIIFLEVGELDFAGKQFLDATCMYVPVVVVLEGADAECYFTPALEGLEEVLAELVFGRLAVVDGTLGDGVMDFL